MNESESLYKKLVKNEMVEALESGQLNPEQQYAVVDGTLQKLILLNNDEITQAAKIYFDDQTKLKEKITVAQESISKSMDEYGENVKAIYEEIKKL